MMRPSGFAAVITFALWRQAFMNKINMGFSVHLRKVPDNFRVFPLLFIFYPVKVAVGNQLNDFLIGDNFRNFKIYKGVFGPAKIHREFIV